MTLQTATQQSMTTAFGGGTPVVGDDGLRGTVVSTGPVAGPPPTTVEISLMNGRRVLVPANLLQRRTDGSYYLPLGPADIAAAADAAGTAATVAAATVAAPASVVTGGAFGTAGPAVGETEVIPLVAEQVEIHKTRVETGKVRISKTVETVQEVVDVALQREDVTVERVPVERFVTEAPPVRHEGNVMIVPVLEEVLVVEKRLMVREELRLTTRRTETHEPRTVTLRKETAHVERVPLD